MLKAMVVGSIRQFHYLSAIIDSMLPKKLKAKDADIHCLLILGLFQLLYMRVADHAAVTETVETVQHLNKKWAKSLLNGVLRRFLREKESLINSINTRDKHSILSHPTWILDQLRHDWPNNWQSIATSNNMHPPMWLRVNQQKTNRKTYLSQLHAAEINATPSKFCSHAIRLDDPITVQKLPFFNEGHASVQDHSAQWTADILDLKPGQTLLDACAAPGGKAAHILEKQPSIELTAADCSGKRLLKLKENFNRLELKAQNIVEQDLLEKHSFKAEHFERILLDAPCSGSGVIRRHPDIKLLRKPKDIVNLAKTQSLLLAALWPLLVPGGKLLYVTCSVFQQENSDVIEAFCHANPDAELKPIEPTFGIEVSFGRQLLPNDEEDGFFYALLEKNAPA